MPKNNLSFKGKNALVTGATRGIGKGIADLLWQHDCKVVYTGTKSENALTCTGRTYKQLDLSDNSSIERLVAELDGVDILVNNAGINYIEPINLITNQQWERIIGINLTGAMILMREISKKMIENKCGGKILNVSSIFGVISRMKRGAYSASKSGLIGLTKAAALDLAPYNILVNAICPGFTNTDLTRSVLSNEEINSFSAEIPLGRMAEEIEIARAAIFLVSDMNTYITGQAVIVDGGAVIK